MLENPRPITSPGIPIGYFEIIPPEILRPFVVCYWSSLVVGQRCERERRILPDGCIDVIFEGNEERSRCQANVVGTMSTSLVLREEEPAWHFGVRFRPGQVRRFLHLSADEITDGAVDLSALWHPAVRDLEQQILEAPTIAARIAAVEPVLLRRLVCCSDTSPYVNAAIAEIERCAGELAIDELGPITGISRQHLGRLFRLHVGVSPKLFCRIHRFTHLVKIARERPRIDWSAIASELGYYDQAHLISDFKKFSGLTPESYISL